MITASTLDTRTRTAHGQVELSLTLELEPGKPTALLRTLALLHRRCCNVTEAEYRSHPHGADRLELRLVAPRAHSHCVTAWLSALIDVRRVVVLPLHTQPDGHSSDGPDSCAEVPAAPSRGSAVHG